MYSYKTHSYHTGGCPRSILFSLCWQKLELRIDICAHHGDSMKWDWVVKIWHTA